MNTVIQKDILEKINFGKVSRYALYLIVVLILQNILFTQMRLLAVCPLVLPAVAVAMGMFEGATWGAVFSLVMGIFADMAFIENTIFFTLLFPALSFLAGFVSNYYINRRFFAYMGAATGGDSQDLCHGYLFPRDDHHRPAADPLVPALRRTGLLSALSPEQAGIKGALCE